MFSVGALMGLVGLVVGVLVAVLGVTLAAATAPERAGLPTRTGEVCESPDASTTWCVQARERAAGLFSPEVHQVWVVLRRDGEDVPRHTYVDVSDYALRGDLRADFADDGITVHLADGVRLFLPADFYALS